jgi:hypothetical protein
MTQPIFTRQILYRRWWLLLAGLIAGVLAGWAVSGITVSAVDTLSIRGIGKHQTPYQADRLALTYARLLPENPTLIAAMSRATHSSPQRVRGLLTMSAQPETNIVTARYSAGNENVALAGLHGFSVGLRSATDAAGSPLRKTVRQISVPGVSGSFSSKRALMMGAAAGLLIALSLALALERRTPRVDDLEDLAGIVPVPVSRVSAARLPALIQRMIGLQERGILRLVAVGPSRLGAPFGKRALAALWESEVAERDDPCALLVKPGVAAAEVEEAWRSCASSGAAVVTALLVQRTPLRQRLRAGSDGLRAG